ncbi:hypothetical protein AAHC03_05397 [Spirometra sp. Aus1]
MVTKHRAPLPQSARALAQAWLESNFTKDMGRGTQPAGKRPADRRNSKRLKQTVKVSMAPTPNRRKTEFKKLMQVQQQHELAKKEKKLLIEAKRKAREEKRTERNKVMRKLTKKGQPIMKDRISYMLKQLEEMRR